MPLISYEIVRQNSTEPLVIRDNCNETGGMSVTNGAEIVVKELFRAGVLSNGRRLFYYDSEDELGELKHKDGVFQGFGFIQQAEFEALFKKEIANEQ